MGLPPTHPTQSFCLSLVQLQFRIPNLTKYFYPLDRERENGTDALAFMNSEFSIQYESMYTLHVE
jgi:hypothetical protein